jgi:adenylate kinase family enzyme
MNSGELVDSETVVNLLADAMDAKEKQVYVISGFPKSMDNWEAWNRKMNNTCHVRSFFSFECSQEMLVKRLEFRNDPNEDFELVKKRHETFNKNIKAVKDTMKVLKKFVEINAERPEASVWRQCKNELEEKLFGKRYGLPKAIFVVGGPGAGKGTQCALLKERMGFEHYSTGDLLRAEVATGSMLGAEIKKVQDAGELVSSDLLVDILKVNLE